MKNNSNAVYAHLRESGPVRRSFSEGGNILIYVLGAIFLMGILLVVMRGSNQQGSNIDEETLMIRVSEVQRYGAELEQAVRLIVQEGYSEADIRFGHPNAASAYGLITDTPARQVFDEEGGAARFRDPPSGIQTTVTPWIFNARNVVNGVGSTGTDHSNVDLVALLMNVSEDFCVLVNELNDVENPLEKPPVEDNDVNYTNLFEGLYLRARHITTSSNEIFGKNEACFEGGGDPPNGTYHYYRVLLSR